MAPRRGAPSVNTLSPPDTGVPSQSPPGFLNFPRSASPSSGFSQFLTKPTKWFNRSASSGNVSGRSSISSVEPRSSTSSGTRKPKISHPTDPRPILDKFHQAEGGLSHHGASRSVLDLSLARTTTNFDQGGHTTRAPSSPSHPAFTKGLGDLRSISRKPWSRSADDLGKVSQTSTPSLTPIDTTFQNKIEQYRTNRADSVSSTAVSPTTSPAPSQHQKNFPFPSSGNSDGLSSSPPQHLGGLTANSSPVSGGTPPLTPVSGGQVHVRSHSFTPRLPSKLSAPKLGGLVPPSPKRKGSASSEIESAIKERAAGNYDREKNISGGSIGAGSSTRPTFPFSMGSGSNKSLSPLNTDVSNNDRSAPNSGLLAPPQIIEPGDEDSPNDKRTSQVVFHQGFINRLADFSPQQLNTRANQAYMSGAGGLVLSKGWKPFKLVMKGSKLYFYKPPGDRSNAIRDLFPTELVVVLEDEGVFEGDEETAEETLGRGKGKERDRKRAYWGRNTHPALVIEDGVIQKGSVEALIHEAVFSTTFLTSTPHETDPESTEQSDTSVVADRYDPAWQEFSSTIVSSLPSTIGRTQFETEFLRCCTLLLDGAEDDQKEEERPRVIWLANQYLSYFSSPEDASAWENWRQKSLAGAPLGSRIAHDAVPQSSSMQAVYSASPALGSSPPAIAAEFSPDLGAFSPRPSHTDRMMSLVDALGDPRLKPALSGQKVKKPWQIMLSRTGLTRDVLLGLDAQLVARSLGIFHERVLQKLPLSITVDACLDPLAENSGVDNLHAAPSTQPAFLKHFLGNDDRIHWLTKLILLQILISDTPGRSSISGVSALGSTDERFSATSRTHSRSEVISAWARVGELCRRTGDECSWRAILNALCARPIARLDKVWKRVEGDAIRTVHSWVYPNDAGEVAHASEAKTIPWAGDRVTQFKQALEHARIHDTEYQVSLLAEARQTFEGLRTELSLCARKNAPPSTELDDVASLVEYWDSVSEGYPSAGMAAKFTRVDQFMSLSLAAEPRRKGAFEPYFWSRAQSPSPFHSLVPLLFPEPLPAIAFVNRALLPRGRLDSTATAYNQFDIQYARELTTSHTVDRRQEKNSLDLGGTTIVLYEGELTLLVQLAGAESMPSSQPSSRAPSRPPSSVVDAPVPASAPVDKGFSRAPSMRVKPGANNNASLERKASQLRRNSLPSLARKPSFMTQDVGSDRPLRVVVKAGTLDRLVDILVEGLHGISVSVADDNGEMSLNAEKTRELRVDVDEYASVWWHTFRSFVTPNVFFELLRKRYMQSQPKVQTQSVASDLASMVRVRLEVLETINKWIVSGGGAQDALDDVQLYTNLHTFLSQPAELPASANETALPRGIAVLEDTRNHLLSLFSAQQKRPQSAVKPSANSSTRPSSIRNFGSDAPDVDQIDAETLVANLDGMACAAFRNVVQEDLFVTADILEVQSADRTGWFPTREPNTISDEVEIQYIQSYLHEIEPSQLISELGQDSFYRLLPPPIRGCVRAFGILRKWLVSRITAHKIGLRTRQTRMELYLRAIEVCRIRNAVPGELPPFERACVRSFAEAILTSAVLSVESRMYHRAWQIVASARGTSCDTLSALLCKPVVNTVSTKEALTTDMGWLLERMLEVISMPDVLESPPAESPTLINFDKRRSLCGLITSAVPLSLPHKSHHRMETSRVDFERLNNIEQSLNSLHFDLRTIREEAYREATQAGPPVPKRLPRPFQAIVVAQQEKNKRDKTLRDRLSKEKRQEQQRQDRREEYLNKAMNPRRPPPSATASKQHRNKKSMSSAFLHFMRPISSAFTSESTPMNAPKRTPAELDFAPVHKPSLVLNVVDVRVSQFINNERSYTFQIDTEDGGHYLLQALDKADMKRWMDTIDKVSKSAAKRRLTYLGNASKLQPSDHLLTPGSASRDPRAVFGVDLDYLLQRDAGGVEPQPGAIPSVIDRLMWFVENKGLTDIGIYRIAGAHSEINNLKDALNRGEWPIEDFTDVNAVCDLIKAWFRVLPGGMFPGSCYTQLMGAGSNDAIDLQTRLANIRQVIHSLPQSNFSLLKRLMEHLDKVTDYEEHNQMTADSLSTVFSPNLLRSSNNDIGFFFANMSSAHRAVKLLITHFHTIFDDVEPEQEVESDVEEEYEHFDEPIPEEDEEEDILSANQESSDENDEDQGGDEDEDRTSRYPEATNMEPPRIDIDIPHTN